MDVKKIKISDIPTSGNYQGYLWYSDQQKPLVLIKESLPMLPDNNSNPFVIEGYLYNESDNLSYSIKYLDGEYLVYVYLNNDEDTYTNKSFITNRIDDSKRINFRQYWSSVKDEYCEGIDVLKPYAFVFVGFNTKTN